jgi:hypothetical protein
MPLFPPRTNSPFMAGAALRSRLSAGLRCTPPGCRTTIADRSPGSRIAAAPRLPMPRSAQWRSGARLPGHSCGGSPGFPRFPQQPWQLPGPASRAIRDVGQECSHRRRAVQHWHGADAPGAAGALPRLHTACADLLDDLPTLRNPAGQSPADVAELALPRPSAGDFIPISQASHSSPAIAARPRRRGTW